MKEQIEGAIRYEPTTDEYLAGITIQAVVVSDRRSIKDREGRKTGRQYRKAVVMGFNRLTQSVVFIPMKRHLPENVPYITSRELRKTLDENYADDIRKAMKHAQSIVVLRPITPIKSTTTP